MSEEKMQVLKMLEQGHITHEEALSLLKALNEGVATNADRKISPGAREEIGRALSDVRAEVRDGLNEGLADLRNTLGEAFGDVREAMHDVSAELGEAMEEARGELSEAMKDIPRTFSGFDWLSGLFSGGTWPEYSFSSEETLDISSEVKQLNLCVETKNGYIHLGPSEDDRAHLYVLKKIRSESREKAAEIAEKCVLMEASTEGAEMKLQLSVEPELQGAISFRLAIPTRLTVGLKLYTKNGSVELSDISGSGSIESKNGRLQVTGGVFDALRAATKNGSISLDTDVSDLNAETKNGAVKCRLQPGRSSKYALESKNGSILVETGTSGASYRVDASTTHGIAKVTLRDFVPQHQSRHILIGQTSDYEQSSVQIELKLVTKNGSVSVHEV